MQSVYEESVVNYDPAKSSYELNTGLFGGLIACDKHLEEYERFARFFLPTIVCIVVVGISSIPIAIGLTFMYCGIFLSLQNYALTCTKYMDTLYDQGWDTNKLLNQITTNAKVSRED